jgi:6-phosphogluconate dehydrogenase (decarboxylating)
MEMPDRTLDRQNKVVVAFLNGERTRGCVYDFSPLKESFNLVPQEDTLQGQGTKVEMKDLKAVFFVKDFSGNSEYHESLRADAHMHGRKIEVTFVDGEKVVGTTEGYNPQRLGFFVIPGDPKSNNTRIFVVTKNTRQIRLV